MGCGALGRSRAVPEIRQAPLGVLALGRVMPGQRVLHLTAPPGVLKDLWVQRQDRVIKGQLLATLLGHDVQAAAVVEATREVAVAASLLAQAQAGEKTGTLAAQLALTTDAQANLKQAETNLARARTLFGQGIFSQAQLDDSQLALNHARELWREARGRQRSLADLRPVDLAVLARRLELAVASAQKARATLELTEIRAPISGQVLEIHTYPGESIGADGILSLGDLDDMMVEAEVDILDIGRVRKGGEVRITSEGLPGEASGKVDEIYGAVAPNAIMGSDPLVLADLRVVRVRIRPEAPLTLQRLVNARVAVRFLP
jgi:HlyD family secretion protein